jgi:hypothetical protein
MSDGGEAPFNSREVSTVHVSMKDEDWDFLRTNPLPAPFVAPANAATNEGTGIPNSD